MRNFGIGFLPVALVLCGCAAVKPAALPAAVIADGARQIAAIYPPAKTRVATGNEALAEKLRSRGFAVNEINPSVASVAPKAGECDLRIDYFVADDAEMFAVIYRIGDDTLARGYIPATYAAMTAWSRGRAAKTGD